MNFFGIYYIFDVFSNMKIKVFFFCINFMILISVANTKAQEELWKKEITPFSNLGTNAIHSFTGRNLFWQIGGVAASYGIIKTKTDYNVHNYFSENAEKYNTFSLPAVYIGYTVPVALGGGMYIYGLFSDNPKPAAAGSAVLQSAFLAWAETSVLKIFTGRQNPDNFIYTKDNDASETFRFGLMRNGIHYGWPSGHLAVCTAVISSLTTFYADNKFVKLASWVSWGYMFLGVVSHEGNTMHWFSDVVTGSMMGVAIGTTVGRKFGELYSNTPNNTKIGVVLTPFIHGQIVGVNMLYGF